MKKKKEQKPLGLDENEFLYLHSITTLKKHPIEFEIPQGKIENVLKSDFSSWWYRDLL